MRRPRDLLIVLILTGLLTLAVSAQVPVRTPSIYLDDINGMTADDAVRDALMKNDELNAMRKEYESSERLIAQANQRARMSVETGGTQSPTSSSYMYNVAGMIPLELGGRRKSRVLTATREAEVKRLAVEQAEAQLAASVRNKFGETLALVLRLELTEELLDSHRATLRLISARVEEGKTAPLEENMMIVELNRVRAMRENLESSVRVSILELGNLVGMDPSEPVRLKGGFDDSPVTLPTRGELTSRALATRPDLLMLRAMEDVADAKIQMSKSEGKLDASATLGYQRLRMNEMMQFNYVVFGIRFTLPYKNSSRDEIEAAVISREATEKRREFGELVVKQEVAKALVKYESAARSREITRVGVVGEAVKNLDVVRQMYELGSNSLLEYLAEQRRVIELRESLINAQLEVYLADVDIKRAVNAPELVAK